MKDWFSYKNLISLAGFLLLFYSLYQSPMLEVGVIVAVGLFVWSFVMPVRQSQETIRQEQLRNQQLREIERYGEIRTFPDDQDEV